MTRQREDRLLAAIYDALDNAGKTDVPELAEPEPTTDTQDAPGREVGGDEPDRPTDPADVYAAALAAAEAAASRHRRANNAARALSRRLTGLPRPWVRPALRIFLTASAAAAMIVLARWNGAPYPPWWLMAGFSIAAVWAGERAGAMVRRAVHANRRLARFVLLATATACALAGGLAPLGLLALTKTPTIVWSVATTGLAVAVSAATLPWLGAFHGDLKTLRRRLVAARERERQAYRLARGALGELDAVHRRNLAPFRRFRRRPGKN